MVGLICRLLIQEPRQESERAGCVDLRPFLPPDDTGRGRNAAGKWTELPRPVC